MVVKDLIKNSLLLIIEEYNCQYFSLDLKLDKKNIKVVYKSSICLQLANNNNLNALDLATVLQLKLEVIMLDLGIRVNVSGEGWLEFEIDDRLLSQQLNILAKKNLHLSAKSSISNIIFIDYYLHSRCCSLLINAHNLSIIQLNNLEFILNQWKIYIPEKIPFYLCNSIEELKAKKYIMLIDEQIENNKLNYNSSLKNLREIFLKLESGIQIISKEQELLQSKLGLIGLVLHYYQNIFYGQYEQLLPLEI